MPGEVPCNLAFCRRHGPPSSVARSLCTRSTTRAARHPASLGQRTVIQSGGDFQLPCTDVECHENSDLGWPRVASQAELEWLASTPFRLAAGSPQPCPSPSPFSRLSAPCFSSRPLASELSVVHSPCSRFEALFTLSARAAGSGRCVGQLWAVVQLASKAWRLCEAQIGRPDTAGVRRPPGEVIVKCRLYIGIISGVSGRITYKGKPDKRGEGEGGRLKWPMWETISDSQFLLVS